MESWKRADPSQRPPIPVLTGCLGGGKTTGLNHLMQQPALGRALLLINQFGEIGLDHDLVTHSKDDPVVEMARGWRPYPMSREGSDVGMFEVRP